MQPIRCIIVDDEPLPLVLLTDYVRKVPFLTLAGTYNNPLQALSALQRDPVDLVLLDIQMPELNGVQFRELTAGRTQVIFTTAYPNYALKGYDLDVVDYLLKPISFERFLKAVQKVRRPEPPAPPDFLFVKSDQKILRIGLAGILYVESRKEYVAIHTAGKKVITLQTLRKMEEMLPSDRFIRVHKSFIVALDKIDSVERNRIFIADHVVPIGETYKDAFSARLGLP